MADDARISTALPRHPKTVKLQRRLGPAGCWSLVCLLLWVADNRSNGDLSGLTAEDIEIAAGWSGTEGALVRTLAEVKFLDGEEGSYTIHDWPEHNPYVASRQQRVEAARAAVQARWKGSTPEQRSDSARQAATARWAREKNNASAVHTDAQETYASCVPPSLPLPTTHRTTKDKSKSCDAKASRMPFAPPTPEDVAAYCKERGGKVNPEQFHDFYSSNGWKVGRNPMRDWRSAVRTWERNESFRGKNGNGTTANRAQQRLNDNLAACAAVKRDFGLVS
jgi:hypothetical protein